MIIIIKNKHLSGFSVTCIVLALWETGSLSCLCPVEARMGFILLRPWTGYIVFQLCHLIIYKRKVAVFTRQPYPHWTLNSKTTDYKTYLFIMCNIYHFYFLVLPLHTFLIYTIIRHESISWQCTIMSLHILI